MAISRVTTFFALLPLLVTMSSSNPLHAAASLDKTLNNKPPATVLLITATKLAPSWRTFADWKSSNGKFTVIKTVDEIATKYKGKSIQEKIRLCVRDHIENHGMRWLILGGDCKPGGKGLVPGGHTTVHLQEKAGIPTDIVYLSSTNWDADGDGIYGEWQDDRKAIEYPDGTIGLGRIPVRTAADVKAYTAKVIAYESNYPADKFATQMVYTCTDAPAYAKVINSWHGYVSRKWKHGKAQRFFTHKTPWDDAGKPGSYPLSPDNLVGLINQKSTGKLHIHGHGHLPVWVLENKSLFTFKDVNRLTNTGAYPLITTVSCNTGEYDSDKDPSIVESMLRKPKGGSVAIVAPIRTGKAHFHHQSEFKDMVQNGKLDGTTQTMTRYWSYGLGADLTTGESLMLAKAAMKADALKSPTYHLGICELNLLGDPTLDMRARSPRTPQLKITVPLKAGHQEVSIETGISGSDLCFWQKDGLYQNVTTDEQGNWSGKLSLIKGKLLVTAYGPSLNSQSKSIQIK